ARGQHQCADIPVAACIDDIDHAAHADIQHQIRLRVEKLSAVDESKMVDLVDALCCLVEYGSIANIAGDEFNIIGDLGKAAKVSARIVVEDANMVAGFEQGFDKPGADETAAARNQYAAHPRISSFTTSRATSIHAPC